MKPKAEPSTLHNLPAPLTPFVGREAEYAKILERLRDPSGRLMTITGAGGVGKTRLAQEVARSIVQEADGAALFEHGVYFVALAPLAPRESLDDVLAMAIAGAIGLSLSGADSPPAQLRRYLRAKGVLLVLDNVEHLSSSGPFLLTLLQDAPRLQLLVTSRERLRLRGEQVVELSGLPFPDDRRPTADDRQAAPAAHVQPPVVGGQWSVVDLEAYPAVRLFVEHARALAPDFGLTAENAPDVVRICRLVDGIPLGIELAAIWARFLAPGEIAAEIAQSLDFLTAATQDLPERQRSLRAVFDYSWNLLSTPEQEVLRRLSVFRGSFSREAAAHLCAEVSVEALEERGGPGPQLFILNVLASLVDKSLVRRVATGGVARYDLLDPLRQYAAERLDLSGVAAATAARHAAYYLDMVAARTEDLRGAQQQAALAALVAEIEQIRAAWRWAVEQGNHRALGRAAAGLFHVYDMSSWFSEGAAVFGAAAAALEGRSAEPDVASALGRLLARQGWFTFHLGRQVEARALLERSVALLRAEAERPELIFALNYLGAVCSYLGDYHQTEALCQESLLLSQGTGDRYSRAVACNILGQMAYERGDYAAARDWSRQSLAIEEVIGNRWSMSYSLTSLGKVAYASGDYAEARRLFTQSLAVRQETGDVRGVAICFNRLGDTAVALGEPGEAGDHYTQALLLFREIGNQWGMASALGHLGRLATDRGRDGAALRLLQEALRVGLEIAALPQVADVVAAAAPLAQRHGEPAWAAVLRRAGQGDVPDASALQPHADRLLHWQIPGSAALTLEEAIAAARAPRESRAAEQRPAPQEAAARVGLTAREIDVLRLVAQGLTDAQVAERLVVSPRTVSTHLTSIYGKLQVNSRSAATRFAVENGLV